MFCVRSVLMKGALPRPFTRCDVTRRLQLPSKPVAVTQTTPDRRHVLYSAFHNRQRSPESLEAADNPHAEPASESPCPLRSLRNWLVARAWYAL